MTRHHSDSSQGWIKRRFAKIEKQMREDRAAKKLQAATIGKGGLTIKLGGFLSSRYPPSAGGGEATRFGPLTAEESSEPGYAFQLKDETGQIVFTVVRNLPNDDNPSGSTGFFVTNADSIFIDDGAGTGFSNFGGAAEFSATDHILFDGGSGGTRIFHSTTGASANCFIDPSDSRIWRSTSSRRYKQDIEDAEVDPATVLHMQPRTWRDKGEVEKDPDTERRYAGFIAEEVDDLGLGQFVVYNEAGQPDAISYDRLAVALLAVLKDQQARIEALEERISTE